MNTPDYSDLIPLCELPARLPRVGGKPIAMNTLRRWQRSGRLPCVQIGGRYYVTPEAVAALVQPGNPPVAARRPRARMETQARWTAEVLRAHGLG